MGRTNPPTFSAEALELMKRYPWPGNIRELRNVVERALLLSSGQTITAAHLPVEKMTARFAPRRPSELLGLAATSTRPVFPRGSAGQLHDTEKERIRAALEACSGNQSEAAKLLGVSRRTLINRLDAYGISGPRKKRGP